MKYSTFLTILAIMLVLTSQLHAQSNKTDCKVLLEAISGTYLGECKDGLAHGTGNASGIDEYTGKFKNGLPDGEGKYTWDNGDYYEGDWSRGKRNGKGKFFNVSENKLIIAMWKDDKIKKELTKGYDVLKASSVNFVRAKKDVTLPPNTIQVEFKISSKADFFDSVELKPSSGYFIKSNKKVIFRDVSFPFKTEVNFEISGSNFIIHKRCMVEFEIYQNASWTVTIDG